MAKARFAGVGLGSPRGLLRFGQLPLRGVGEEFTYHATKQVRDATNNRDPKPGRDVEFELRYQETTFTAEDVEEYFLRKIVRRGGVNIPAVGTETTGSHACIEASLWGNAEPQTDLVCRERLPFELGEICEVVSNN
jgi:hypothetical protein